MLSSFAVSTLPLKQWIIPLTLYFFRVLWFGLLFALKCFFKWSNIEFALSLLSVLIYRTYYLESLIDEVFLWLKIMFLVISVGINLLLLKFLVDMVRILLWSVIRRVLVGIFLKLNKFGGFFMNVINDTVHSLKVQMGYCDVRREQLEVDYFNCSLGSCCHCCWSYLLHYE